MIKFTLGLFTGFLIFTTIGVAWGAANAPRTSDHCVINCK